jgi:hypothetical protein
MAVIRPEKPMTGRKGPESSDEAGAEKVGTALKVPSF